MNIPTDFWQSKEVWAAALQAAVGVLQGFATLLAVWLAYRFGLRQLHRQTKLQVQQDLRRRQADALQAAWGLLQCLTTMDNGHNFLRYEQDKKSGSESPQRHYFLHLPSAHAFVYERLPDAFYASGAGLHWNVSVKERFFECRTLIYGLLLASKQSRAVTTAEPDSEFFQIQKIELAQRIDSLYHELNDLLRKEIQAVYEPIFYG